jgi:hypothetical protein
LFITNLISNCNKNDIVYRFKRVPYLIGVFKSLMSFGATAAGTDSNSGGLSSSWCREALVSPQQITDHIQGHITRSERPVWRSRLKEVEFETKLFTKKINGIILGDMTRPAEERYNGVLL